MSLVSVDQHSNFNDYETVSALLERLGADFSSKKPDMDINGVNAHIGEDIVKKGFSDASNQKNARRQSKHFVCTSCHNLVQEDPDLSNPNPRDRLVYASQYKLPYLQATTLYGAVNRESYYNGDYEKKYGELVYPARKNIREAIQLCATECSQGRKLEPWELESVLAYLWEIQLRVDDLEISDKEKISIESAMKNDVIQGEARKLIKTKYMLASKATWIGPPDNRKEGVGLSGDPENGERLYELSCMHCHYQKRYSFLHLDKGKMSLNYLKKKAPTYDRHSIYQVVRYGTVPKYGKKSYMPFYTEEKISDQQLADLISYIQQKEVN